MKKTILIFTLFILFVLTNGSAQTGLWTDEGNYDISWYDETATEFTLTTPAQLAGLAKLVNDGNGFYGKTIKLGKDINLGAHCWWPIGTDTKQNGYYNRCFTGIFDGNNHTISQMIINETQCKTYDYIGLFGQVKNGTLSGIILSADCMIESGASQEEEYSAAGGIASTLNKSSIKDCISYASVSYRLSGGIVGTIDGDSNISNCTNHGIIQGIHIGGIAGSSDGIITQCRNNGNINGTWSSGGIAGYSNGALSECKNSGDVTSLKGAAGGIAGTGMGKTISKCENSGNITTQATGQGYDCPAAGIIGYAEADGFQYVEYCTNSGNITGETAAGIVGALRPVGWYIREIRGCNNHGIVSGMHWSGGIIAYNDASLVILNCTNSGSVNATETIVATYDIQGTMACAGGIVAFSAPCINCCNYGSVTASARTQGQDTRVTSNALCGGINGGCQISYNCFNRGDLTCNSYAHTNSKSGYATAELHVGGITAGDRQCEAINCYNSGKISHSISSYTAAGEQDANKSPFIGGIIGGYVYSTADTGPIINNCYYSNEGLKCESQGGTTGYTTLSKMKTQSFADLLNEKRSDMVYNGKSYPACPWKLDESDGLPVFDIDQYTAIDNTYQDQYVSKDSPLFCRSVVSTVAVLNLSISDDTNIYIYTTNGILISQYVTNSNILDVSRHPDGHYIVVVRGKEFCKSGKLVIKH